MNPNVSENFKGSSLIRKEPLSFGYIRLDSVSFG
jgi:hypothetical protein